MKGVPVLRMAHSAIVCALCLVSLPSNAVLGESGTATAAAKSLPKLSPGTVRRIQAVAVPAQAPYSIAESELETGTLLREYLLANGVVFAVTWVGPVLPDLQNALGSHFATFTQEVKRARTQGVRGGPVGFDLNGFVVRSNGRMGAFFGHAYLTNLVPNGVDINEILK